MCTHNQCFRVKIEKYYIFYLKINIFTAVKDCMGVLRNVRTDILS